MGSCVVAGVAFCDLQRLAAARRRVSRVMSSSCSQLSPVKE